MTPTDLRALAARCCSGETGSALLVEVKEAIFPPPRGYGGPYERWQHKIAAFGGLIRGRHFLEFSVALMPTGWSVLVHAQPAICAVMASLDFAADKQRTVAAEAPTEHLARTAAALLVRAAEMEAAHAE